MVSRSAGASRKRGRLSRSGDFDRAYRDGSSESNRHLVLYVFGRQEAEKVGTRLGISVGKKVGGAVERNSVKRRLRESFWALAGDAQLDRDIVIVARPGILDLIENESPGALRASLGELLAAAGVVVGGDSA